MHRPESDGKGWSMDTPPTSDQQLIWFEKYVPIGAEFFAVSAMIICLFFYLLAPWYPRHMEYACRAGTRLAFCPAPKGEEHLA